MPPGRTPLQFDMKSDRQFCRIAFCCSWVGCCADAAPATNTKLNPAKPIVASLPARLSLHAML